MINKALFASSNLYLFCIGILSYEKYIAASFLKKQAIFPTKYVKYMPNNHLYFVFT